MVVGGYRAFSAVQGERETAKGWPSPWARREYSVFFSNEYGVASDEHSECTMIAAQQLAVP